MAQRTKILVLGAGVVGTATAYWLARDGHDVTVLDRQPGPGLETSFANGGQVSVAHAGPWAGPDTPGKVLRWLGRPDAPLLFRFQWDPHMWRWCWRFLRECTTQRARINTERALRVALYSRTCLDDLRSESGIDYDARAQGIVHIYRDAREFDRARQEAEHMGQWGLRRDVLTPQAVAKLDPAFKPFSETLAGATFSPDDESGDAFKFTTALAAMAERLGARFEYGSTVRHLVTDGTAVTGAVTDKGTIEAETVVLSLGSYSPLLARPLGLNLPVYPAKGYSVSLPVTNPARAPEVSLTDDEHKLVYSRLTSADGDILRIAGTAELAGYDITVNPVRTRAILNAATALFPGATDPARATFWAGLRPKTPDSVPIIGPTRYANLFLNTGHGTLGWTMACGAGRITADLIGGRVPAIDLAGLGIDRFA